MVASRATLPDLDGLDPNELKALIVSQHELIVSRDSELERLKLLIAKLQRMRFGRSSEKLDRQIEQLELQLEALQQNDAEKVAALPEPLASAELKARSGTTTAAGTSTAGSADLSTKARSLPGLRWQAEASGRRCFGDAGNRIDPLQSDPPGSAQDGLRGLRSHRAGRSTEPANRARGSRTGTSGACSGIEIR